MAVRNAHNAPDANMEMDSLPDCNDPCILTTSMYSVADVMVQLPPKHSSSTALQQSRKPKPSLVGQHAPCNPSALHPTLSWQVVTTSLLSQQSK